MKRHDNNTMLKAVSGFLIVLVAFSVLIIFATYQDNIINSDAFHPFIFLTVIGMVLLLALMYLINNSNFNKASSKKRKK